MKLALTGIKVEAMTTCTLKVWDEGEDKGTFSLIAGDVMDLPIDIDFAKEPVRKGFWSWLKS